VLSPLDYWLYAAYLHSGRLVADGRSLPLLWVLPVGYVLLPFLTGRIVGAAVARKKGWARALAGRQRAPRAWDDLFSSRPTGWVRMKLKSGIWVGGAFGDAPGGRESYAAQYPGEHQDVYVALQGEWGREWVRRRKEASAEWDRLMSAPYHAYHSGKGPVGPPPQAWLKQPAKKPDPEDREGSEA